MEVCTFPIEDGILENDHGEGDEFWRRAAFQIISVSAVKTTAKELESKQSHKESEGALCWCMQVSSER